MAKKLSLNPPNLIRFKSKKFIFRVIDQKILNFVALLKPIHAGGVNLYIYGLLNWKTEMFALLACLVGKVRSLEIDGEMDFSIFFLIKQLLMKNATKIVINKGINKEVSFLGNQ